VRPPLPEGPYLVVGLARSGVAALRALRGRGVQATGVDAGTPAVEEPDVHLGVDGVALLDGVATVVKSPGVPQTAPVIAAARSRGLTVMGELELAWRLLPNPFVAVTGTNGKTTTVGLLGHILGERAVVAGNVGTALSSLDVPADVRVVAEASSFQLEDTLAFAPEVGALINLSSDHLDRHGTLAAYTAAKLEAFARQTDGDLAVLPVAFAQDGGASPAPGGSAPRVTFGPGGDVELAGGVISWRGEPLLGAAEVGLRGAHNLENAMAVAAVCLARGVDREAVRAGLRSFRGVPHRLEEVARSGGVLYVNDSKATNVASAVVALAAFKTRVHLIAGGQGKGQDFAPLRAAAAGAADTPRIRSAAMSMRMRIESEQPGRTARVALGRLANACPPA